MSVSSKVFAGSDLTPSGDAVIIGDALAVLPVAAYDLDSAAMSAFADGTAVPGWTFVDGSGSGSFTIQTNAGEKVARMTSTGWGGAYENSLTDVLDGTFLVVAKAVGGRVNTVMRYSNTVARGYPLQFINNSERTLWNSMPTNFFGVNTPIRVAAGAFNYSLPVTIRLTASNLSNGDVVALLKIAGGSVAHRVFRYLDTINKWPAGRIAAQVFSGTTDYTRLAFFRKRTGGFTLSAVPHSVSAVNRIVVQGDFDNSLEVRPSQLFEYRLDGGSWTPLPDDGVVGAACSASIEVRSNGKLANDADASGGVLVAGVGIEIEGEWEPFTPPPVDAPTDLQAGTPTATSIPIAWTDAASPAAFYDAEAATDLGGPWTPAGYQVQGVGALEICNLNPETEYFIRLRSRSAEGAVSAWAGPVSATTATASTPGQPTALTATAAGARRIGLTWLDGADADVNILYRGLDGDFGNALPVATVLAGVQAYLDSGLTPGTDYFYWLVPFNSNGAGPVSDDATATTGLNAELIQQLIFDNILEKMSEVTISNGFRTDIGLNVIPWKINDWLPEQMPGVSIADTTDTLEDWKMRGAGNGERGGIQKNLMQVEFAVAMAGATDDSEAALLMAKVREAIADIYDVIRRNYKWGGYALNTTPQTHSLQAVQEEKVICGAKVVVQVEFRTLAFKADETGLEP